MLNAFEVLQFSNLTMNANSTNRNGRQTYCHIDEGSTRCTLNILTNGLHIEKFGKAPGE